MSETVRLRLDNWLKHVCLFKHRAEATDAINGGHVKLNGRSVKASTNVKIDDVVEFKRGDWERKFVITVLAEKQLSKEESREAYRDESGEKPDRGDSIDKIFAAPVRDKGAGRPTKKDRRDLEREGFRRA